MISRVYFPKPPKLLIIQPTKFLPQNNSKSESMNFPNTRCRQNSAHILFLSKPLFPYIFPDKNLKAPLQGGDSQNIRLPRQTQKKHLSLSCSAPMTRFIRDNSSRYRLRKILDNIHVPNNWYQQLPQKTGLIPPAPKISVLLTSQISKPVPNVLTTDIRNPWTTPSMLPKFHLSD